MENGDVLRIDGQRYILLGVDPGGVTPRLAYLEHKLTGARAFWEYDLLTAEMVLPRLRLVHGGGDECLDEVA
jgi:hypothetical protein